MIKFTDYDVVFQEIPGEVTLAINLSLCPNNCPGCHSSALLGDIGEELTFAALDALLVKYLSSITCVSFMGGDNDKPQIVKLAAYLKEKYNLKTGWYSGQDEFPESDTEIDYAKLGGYKEEFGALKQRTTNQRMYKRENGQWVDITSKFWK